MSLIDKIDSAIAQPQLLTEIISNQNEISFFHSTRIASTRFAHRDDGSSPIGSARLGISLVKTACGKIGCTIA